MHIALRRRRPRWMHRGDFSSLSLRALQIGFFRFSFHTQSVFATSGCGIPFSLIPDFICGEVSPERKKSPQAVANIVVVVIVEEGTTYGGGAEGGHGGRAKRAGDTVHGEYRRDFGES